MGPQFSCCPSSNLVIILTELPKLQRVLQTRIKQHQSELTVTVYLQSEFTIIPLHIPTSTPILATKVRTSGVTRTVVLLGYYTASSGNDARRWDR